MGEVSNIAWTDATFNPWIGCARVSAGCENCYAEALAKRHGDRWGVKWGIHGSRSITSLDYWKQPLRWNKKAAKEGRRMRVFCASLADVFEDRPDLAEARERLARLIVETPALDWLLLTKRPENIVKLWPSVLLSRNVWLGTTAENQATYDRRWPLLARAAERMRPALTFISYEPAIGPLLLQMTDQGEIPNWLIVGGESGPAARDFDVAWASIIVAQCQAVRIPVFVKQLGRNPFHQGVRLHLNDPKGGDPTEWPEHLKVREFPRVHVRGCLCASIDPSDRPCLVCEANGVAS